MPAKKKEKPVRDYTRFMTVRWWNINDVEVNHLEAVLDDINKKNLNGQHLFRVIDFYGTKQGKEIKKNERPTRDFSKKQLEELYKKYR